MCCSGSPRTFTKYSSSSSRLKDITLRSCIPTRRTSLQWIRRPRRHEFLERVAMETEVVSPVPHRLRPHVGARGQPHLLHRVVGVMLGLLLRRQPEELRGHLQHLRHRLHSMIHNLRIQIR